MPVSRMINDPASTHPSPTSHGVSMNEDDQQMAFQRAAFERRRIRHQGSGPSLSIRLCSGVYFVSNIPPSLILDWSRADHSASVKGAMNVTKYGIDSRCLAFRRCLRRPAFSYRLFIVHLLLPIRGYCLVHLECNMSRCGPH